MTSCPFFMMAAGSHIGFDLGNIRPPTTCNCWSCIGPQIWVLIWSTVLVIWRFLFFLKLPIPGHFWGVLGHISPPKYGDNRSNPQKDHPCAETRRLSNKAWWSVQRFDLGVGSRKKGKNSQTKKSQSGNISLFGDKPPLHRLKPKFACWVVSPT